MDAIPTHFVVNMYWQHGQAPNLFLLGASAFPQPLRLSFVDGGSPHIPSGQRDDRSVLKEPRRFRCYRGFFRTGRSWSNNIPMDSDRKYRQRGYMDSEPRGPRPDGDRPKPQGPRPP